MEAKDLIDNILTRSSVRRYTDEPVSEAEKEALLRAAMAAPTGVNKQPWEFYLVEDKAVLQALANDLPYAKMTDKAPMAIVVCGNRDRFLDGEDSTLWVQDLSAASENILLAAHALGLGGVWTCLYPHTDRMEAVKDVLGLPARLVPFNLIPVGHPAGTPHRIEKFDASKVHVVGPAAGEAKC